MVAVILNRGLWRLNTVADYAGAQIACSHCNDSVTAGAFKHPIMRMACLIIFKGIFVHVCGVGVADFAGFIIVFLKRCECITAESALINRVVRMGGLIIELNVVMCTVLNGRLGRFNRLIAAGITGFTRSHIFFSHCNNLVTAGAFVNPVMRMLGLVM